MTTPRTIYMANLPVVGTHHRIADATAFVRAARQSARFMGTCAISLQADPGNTYDAHAIKVIGSARSGPALLCRTLSWHIGYLPRKAAYRVSINDELSRIVATLARIGDQNEHNGIDIFIDLTMR